MKTRQDIELMIQQMESDERLSYPPASVDVNAPLALIQVELEAGIKMLRWVLK